LTQVQVEVLLTVAADIDSEPGKLEAILPKRAQRVAFRGATKALERIYDTMRPVTE
jgi:hypothetical protein